MSAPKFTTIFDPKTEWNFVGFMPTAVKIGFAIPIISIIGLAVLGINWGLDFKGGTEMQVKFPQAATVEGVKTALDEAGFSKQRVQQYGSADNNEVLIRVERLTSLTEDDVKKVEDALKARVNDLKFGSTLGADSIGVRFRAADGDRMIVYLPAPVPTRPTLNQSPEAAANALSERLMQGETPEPLDDATLTALSAMGLDRGVVTRKAVELGIEVTASEEARSEPPFAEAIARERLLKEQEALLGAIIEAGGAKLRQTKKAGDKVATTADAIMRDEPYQGRVKYTVQFRGVSVDIERALAKKFAGAEWEACLGANKPAACPEIRRVEFVDAQVAEQLQTDGALAVLLALLMILVYVALRFDLFFSPGAVIALIHDAIGAMALFAFGRLQFDVPSIAALLTVVGYSINNTIVIYDRIRETVPPDTDVPLSDAEVRKYVNKAINDTWSRTVNTSLTTILASVSLFIFVDGVVKNFAAVLSLGIILGAFSSTFLAPATYLFFRKTFQTRGGKTKEAGGVTREDKARGIV